MTAKAVSDFLMEDVLRVDAAVERPRGTSYEALLEHAASQVDTRLKDEPEAAAKVHWLLGQRLHEIGQADAGTIQYERAAALFTQIHGRGAEPTLFALERLMSIYCDTGRVPEALAIADEIRALWEPQLGKNSLSMLAVRVRITRTFLIAGELARAEKEFRAILSEIPRIDAPKPETAAFLKHWFGTLPSDTASLPEYFAAHVRGMLGVALQAELYEDYSGAEATLRESLAVIVKFVGEDSEPAAVARSSLGFLLAHSGSYEESEALLLQARNFYDEWLPAKNYYRALPRLALARLRLEQHRPKEAVELLAEALSFCNVAACTPRVRAEHTWDLGRAYYQLGRLDEAARILRESLATYEKFRGPNHVTALKIRLSLAETLREAGQKAEAWNTVSAITPQAIASLRPQQLVLAELRRVQGLLWLADKEYVQARPALEEAKQIFSLRLGGNHWRTERAVREAALATRR